MFVHIKGCELLTEIDSFSVLLGNLKASVFSVAEWRKNTRNANDIVGSSVKAEAFDMYPDPVRKPALLLKSNQRKALKWTGTLSRFLHPNYCYCQSSIHDPFLASFLLPLCPFCGRLIQEKWGETRKSREEKWGQGQNMVCKMMMLCWERTGL